MTPSVYDLGMSFDAYRNVEGSNRFHYILFGPVCEVFLVSVSYWEGKLCESGGIDARELLREGAA